MGRILIADDEPLVRDTLVKVLNKAGFTDIVLTDNGSETLEMIDGGGIDIAIIDVHMPPPTGIEILKHMGNTGSKTVPIILSGGGLIKDAIYALRLGAYDFMHKPPDMEKMVAMVRWLLAARYPEEHEEDL